MNEAEIEKYMHSFQDKLRRSDEQAAALARAGLAPDVEYLVFAAGGEEFAVPMRAVQATMQAPKCTPIPFVGPEYRGIVAHRDRIFSVIDLRLKMGLEASDSPETVLLVLERDGDWRGFVVDSVNRALTVKNDDELKPVTKLELDRLFGASHL